MGVRVGVASLLISLTLQFLFFVFFSVFGLLPKMHQVGGFYGLYELLLNGFSLKFKV